MGGVSDHMAVFSTYEKELRPLTDEEIKAHEQERLARESDPTFQRERLDYAAACAKAAFDEAMDEY